MCIMPGTNETDKSLPDSSAKPEQRLSMTEGLPRAFALQKSPERAVHAFPAPS